MFRRVAKQLPKKGVVRRLTGAANKSAPKAQARLRPKGLRPTTPESPKTVFSPSESTTAMPLTNTVKAKATPKRHRGRSKAHRGAPSLVMRAGLEAMQQRRLGLMQRRTYLTQAGGLPDDISSLCIYGSNTVVFSLHDLLAHKPEALPKDITLIVPDFWLDMVLPLPGNEALKENPWGQSFSDLDPILREVLLEIDPHMPEELQISWEHYYQLRHSIIEKLKERGIKVVHGTIERVEELEDASVRVHMEGGQSIKFDNKAAFCAWHGELRKLASLEHTVIDYYQDPSLRKCTDNEDFMLDHPVSVHIDPDVVHINPDKALPESLSEAQEATLDAMLLIGLGAQDARLERLADRHPDLYKKVEDAGVHKVQQAADRVCADTLPSMHQQAYRAHVGLGMDNMTMLTQGVDATDLLPDAIASMDYKDKIRVINALADDVEHERCNAIGQVGAGVSAQWMRQHAEKGKQFVCIGRKADIEAASPRDNKGNDAHCTFFDDEHYEMRAEHDGKWGYVVDQHDVLNAKKVTKSMRFFAAIGYTGDPTHTLFSSVSDPDRVMMPPDGQAILDSMEGRVDPAAVLPGSMLSQTQHVRIVNEVELPSQSSRFDKKQLQKDVTKVVAGCAEAEALLPYLDEEYFDLLAAGHQSLTHGINPDNAMHFAGWVLQYKAYCDTGETLSQGVRAAFMRSYREATGAEAKAAKEHAVVNKALGRLGKSQRDLTMHHASVTNPKVRNERAKHGGVGSIEHMQYHTIAKKTGEHPDEVRARMQKQSGKRLHSKQQTKPSENQPE